METTVVRETLVDIERYVDLNELMPLNGSNDVTFDHVIVCVI